MEKIIYFEHKDILTLTTEKFKSHKNKKHATYVENNLIIKAFVRDHCHFTGKIIPQIFPKSNYDFHFNMKNLADELEGNIFNCLR